MTPRLRTGEVYGAGEVRSVGDQYTVAKIRPPSYAPSCEKRNQCLQCHVIRGFPIDQHLPSGENNERPMRLATVFCLCFCISHTHAQAHTPIHAHAHLCLSVCLSVCITLFFSCFCSILFLPLSLCAFLFLLMYRCVRLLCRRNSNGLDNSSSRREIHKQ